LRGLSRGRLDFDRLTERIHPAASRVKLLAGTTPASFVAFDLLALGDEALASDPRFATTELQFENHADLLGALDRALAAAPSAHWVDRFSRFDVMHSVVNDPEAFRAHPGVRESGLFAMLNQPGVDVAVPIPRLPGAPHFCAGDPTAAAPRAGQHSIAILEELGYASEEVADLISGGVVSG